MRKCDWPSEEVSSLDVGDGVSNVAVSNGVGICTELSFQKFTASSRKGPRIGHVDDGAKWDVDVNSRTEREIRGEASKKKKSPYTQRVWFGLHGNSEPEIGGHWGWALPRLRPCN